MKIDVLAFGVHPDDVELGCAGVLMIEKKNGKRTGIIDLTQGELGTRGTPETRGHEAARAAKILQLDVRENLRLPDGFFQNDKETQLTVVEAIRAFQPEIVICNAPEDRHPDHGRSAALVADACFLSGLSKIETQRDSKSQEAWRPKYVFHYIQDRYLKPDFVIDITEVYEQKAESVKAYQSQFHSPDMSGPQTYISSPDFLESVKNRHQMFGKMIGVKYAEGFISKKMIGFNNFDALVKHST